MNYSDFKKVHQDEKVTKLQHKDGHVLHIAHKNLNEKLKKQLDALPMAKGGDVKLDYAQKGVHHQSGEEGNGTSISGKDVRAGDTEQAKKSHQYKLSELKSMPKPKIQGFADGGTPQDPDPEEAKKFEQGAQQGQSVSEGLQNVKNEVGSWFEAQGGDINKQILASHKEILKRLDALSPQKMADGGKPDGGYLGNYNYDADSGSDDQVPPQSALQQPQSPQQQQQQAALPQFSDQQSPYFQLPSNTQAELNAPSPEQQRQQSLSDALAQHKMNEAQDIQAFGNDLVNGHITPKTYGDWFADKGTLGKIGSLFGMLVGGAGSGLAHQPNLLMHMMDNQIQNDLQAQIKSKDNAQNFIKLNQADLLNKAGAINNFSAAQTAVQANAMSQMYQSSFHKLMEESKNLPPQEQMNRMQALKMLWPEVSKRVNDLGDASAAAKAEMGINPWGHQGGTSPQQPQQGAPGSNPAAQPANDPYTPTAQQLEEEKGLTTGSDKAPFTPPPRLMDIDMGKAKMGQLLGKNGAPYQPSEAELSQLNGESDDVNKANQALKEIHKQFPMMWKNGQNASPLQTGHFNIMGSDISMPNILSGIKEYNTASATIKKIIGNAVKGGLTPAMEAAIQKNLVNQRDTPEEYRNKLQNLDQVVTQGLDTAVARKYKYGKNLPQ